MQIWIPKILLYKLLCYFIMHLLIIHYSPLYLQHFLVFILGNQTVKFIRFRMTFSIELWSTRHCYWRIQFRCKHSNCGRTGQLLSHLQMMYQLLRLLAWDRQMSMNKKLAGWEIPHSCPHCLVSGTLDDKAKLGMKPQTALEWQGL